MEVLTLIMAEIINTEKIFDGLKCTISNDPGKYDYCVGMKEGYIMVQTVRDNLFARITMPIELIPDEEMSGFISKSLIRIINKVKG